VARAHSSRDSLAVFASASLSGALREMAEACCDSMGGSPPRFTFDDGPHARARLQSGEKPDVIALADSATLGALRRAGRIAPPSVMAHGKLALIAPAADTELISYNSLTKPGLRIASATRDVPLGCYTERMLMRIEGMRRKSNRITGSIRLNLSAREPSSVAVLERVERGEADAGIVYAADAEAAGSKVRTLVLPDAFNPEVPFFVATNASGPHRARAAAFVRYLTGAEAQSVLRRHGFEP